jgi:plastocyanin
LRWSIQISLKRIRNIQGEQKMMKYKNARLVVCAATVVFVVAGFGLFAVKQSKAADQPASNAEVKIDNFTFQPETITVQAGTQVTWVNRDDMPHTITTDDKMLKSKAVDTDEKFSFTFATPGTYKYFCSIHPKMTGEVVVK